MALGSNYMTIGGLSIPNPQKGIKIAYNNIEKTAQSEAGTDLVLITRLMKRTFSFNAQVTSEWYAKFRTLCSASTTTLLYQSESITVRARITSAQLAQNSEFAGGTDGLWTLGIQLIEV